MPTDRQEPARVDLPLGHEFKGPEATKNCIHPGDTCHHERSEHMICGRPESAHRAASEPESSTKRYPRVYECGCSTEGGYPFCPEHGADPVWALPAPAQGSPEHELCGSQACTRTGVHCACHSPHPSGSPDEYEAMARERAETMLREDGYVDVDRVTSEFAALLRSVAQEAEAKTRDALRKWFEQYVR